MLFYVPAIGLRHNILHNLKPSPPMPGVRSSTVRVSGQPHTGVKKQKSDFEQLTQGRSLPQSEKLNRLARQGLSPSTLSELDHPKHPDRFSHNGVKYGRANRTS